MQKTVTQVKSIKVFRRGAEVLRRGTPELQEGAQTICICGLSRTADPDTLRLYGSGGLNCTGYRFVMPDADAADENEEAARIRAKIEALNQQIGIMELQAGLWQSNGDFTGSKNRTAEEITAYIEMLPGRLQTLYDGIRSLKEEIGELEKKAAQISEEEALPKVIAEVEAPAAGSYEIELRYHENAAGWSPVYEIHSDGAGPLEFRSRARITQDTGEDWNAVTAALFSGTPSLGGTLPVLDAQYLQIREAQPALMKTAMAGGPAAGMAQAVMGGMMAFASMEAQAPLMRMETQEAETRSDETMTEYLLPGTLIIRKGNDGTMADLQSIRIPASYRIGAVPKKDPNAYLTAVIDPADLPETGGGRAGIYLDGIYSGSVPLPRELTADTAEITLGRAEQIHVSRREISVKNSASLLKGQKSMESVYGIRVTNRTDKDQKVLLKDQIPVSRAKEITVEITELSGGQTDPETGIVSWELSVGAGQTAELKLAYRVSWPKDKMIQTTAGSSGGHRKFCPECGSPVDGMAFCPECGSRI